MDEPKVRIEVVAPQASQSSSNAVPQYHESHELPLPEGWECRLTPKGCKYYVNHNNCTTTWECPMPGNDLEGKLVAEEKLLAGGWEMRRDTSGRNLTQP
jgi:hypothetical protein